MENIQFGILSPIPPAARYLFFSIAKPQEVSGGLNALSVSCSGENNVVGVSYSLVTVLGRTIPGLKEMYRADAQGVEIPSTQVALWCWLRGDDRGELFLRSERIIRLLAPAFELVKAVDAFKYGKDLDLSGYHDGTANPSGSAAFDTAFVQGVGPGLDGSSFVAVQQWLHDFDVLEPLSIPEMDNIMGRRKSDNVELKDAPLSAHVKRTDQESFSPAAPMLRRSMPWVEGQSAGLIFTAFGSSFRAFEVQLQRMLGHEDGVQDALFRFTRPITGDYFWCPPVSGGGIDFSLLIEPERS